MNVFILNTGRCGSSTFVRACKHISNFSAGHESNIRCIGDERFNYPPQHIEADNRLAWFLGRLEQVYGDNAYYVHLHRNLEDTARSFARRSDFGVMKAYKEGLLLGGQEGQTARQLAIDYIQSVESNIAFFLENKSQRMDFQLEQAKTDFKKFWRNIGAQGDYSAAEKEWDINYNASLPTVSE